MKFVDTHMSSLHFVLTLRTANIVLKEGQMFHAHPVFAINLQAARREADGFGYPLD